jgi:hypothetical protein
MALFSIDGNTYPGVLVASLKRNFQVLDGDNAGRVQTGGMVRDIVGTYYNYSIELDAAEASLAEYDSLYEVISAPEDSHALIVPYAQGTLSFDAYVTNGQDELLDATCGRNKWGNLSFNIIAMEPKRVPE